MMSMKKLRRHFKCEERKYDMAKPITTLEEWELMRKKYRENVPEDETAAIKFDDPVPPTLGFTLLGDGPPPYHVEYSPGKGRGLFASRDIMKNELIHDGARSDVMFPADGGIAYRRFVFSLPRDLACDTMMWNYTTRYHGKMRHFLAINISSFMNSSKRPSIAPRSSHSLKMYATRNIRKGEEITYDYSVYKTDWKAVGL